LSPQAQALLEGYNKKKREAATRLIYAIQDNPQITNGEMMSGDTLTGSKMPNCFPR